MMGAKELQITATRQLDGLNGWGTLVLVTVVRPTLSLVMPPLLNLSGGNPVAILVEMLRSAHNAGLAQW